MATKTGTKKSAEQYRHPVIEVKDFGPIAQGRVELRPLTVFAGPSNTGKSWLATLVYAMFRHSLGSWNIVGELGTIWDAKQKKLRFPENPAAWIESLEKGTPIKFTDGEMQCLKSILEGRSDVLTREILRCFGLSDHIYLTREGTTGNAVVNFQSTIGSVLGQHMSKMTIGEKIDYSAEPLGTMNVHRPERSSDSGWLQGLLGLLDLTDSSPNDLPKTDKSKPSYFLQNMFGVLENLDTSPSSVWYLPANRSGVMSTHQVLVTTLIQNASHASISNQQAIPRLSGTFTDMLERLIQLGQKLQETQSMEHEHAKNLENRVIGGQVVIERNDMNYPQFLWQPTGWKRALPMLNVSSMVAELAPVALYLRYYVSPGDLLIIDEPEAHLHPSRQVDLINEVAGWVRAGIRVILTTHSDWVLEALSNLVAESQLEESPILKVAEGQAETEKSAGLRKEEVGFWLFEQGKRGGGSKIREAPWNADEGGFEADFYDTAANLHNRWAYIMGRIDNG